MMTLDQLWLLGERFRNEVGFAIGALVVIGLAWWLHPFFDHHEGTAAWVQAAGALLIIAATARIAGRNSREAQKREDNARDQLWVSIVALARNCLDATDRLLTNHPPPPPSDVREHFLRLYVPSDFEVPMDGLAAVPLHQIGDVALITAVLTLRGIMGRIKKHLDDVERDPVLPQTLETVRGQRTLAFNAVASIFRIVEGTAGEDALSRLAFRDNERTGFPVI